LCKNCAKKFDKIQRKHKIFAIVLLMLVLVSILSATFYVFLVKKNKPK